MTNDSFPVYQAVEWQCRYVEPATKLCCVLGLNHEGPHRLAGKCERCGTRDATETWAPNGVLGYIHGAFQQWCHRCVVEAQLEHCRAAEALVRMIPQLEAQLKDLP